MSFEFGLRIMEDSHLYIFFSGHIFQQNLFLKIYRRIIHIGSILKQENSFIKFEWTLFSRQLLIFMESPKLGAFNTLHWSRQPFPSQGIFQTLGLNPVLLHCRQILYQLGHKGSPRILEREAYPFCSRSSQPRN